MQLRNNLKEGNKSNYHYEMKKNLPIAPLPWMLRKKSLIHLDLLPP